MGGVVNKLKSEIRMLTKQEVVTQLGMSVSWLDNSQSELARSIRASGIRYGKSRTSPIRFPLSCLLKIIEQLE